VKHLACFVYKVLKRHAIQAGSNSKRLTVPIIVGVWYRPARLKLTIYVGYADSPRDL